MTRRSWAATTGVDGGTAVAVTPAGDAVVAGFTDSADFPTLNAAQPQADFAPVSDGFFFENTDAFVTRINATGPGTLTVSNVPFQATEGVPFTGTVASFTDTDTDTAGSYTATISWGDGTTSAGVVVSDSVRGQGFRVEGTHTYAEEGSYPVSVSVQDADGSSGTVSATNVGQSLGGPVTYHVSLDPRPWPALRAISICNSTPAPCPCRPPRRPSRTSAAPASFG